MCVSVCAHAWVYMYPILHTYDIDHPASRTMRSPFLLNHPVHGTFNGSPSRLMQLHSLARVQWWPPVDGKSCKVTWENYDDFGKLSTKRL